MKDTHDAIAAQIQARLEALQTPSDGVDALLRAVSKARSLVYRKSSEGDVVHIPGPIWDELCVAPNRAKRERQQNGEQHEG